MVDAYEPETVLDAFEHKKYETVLRMALPYAQARNPDAQCTVALLHVRYHALRRFREAVL
jgi:hypothetical protein